MDILSSVQFQNLNWPLIAMCFLRIATLFFILPIFGDQAVPVRIRIALSLAFTFFCYPVVVTFIKNNFFSPHWNAITILTTTLKELLFAVCVGYSARLIFFGTSVAAHVAGISMGFQAATMLNPTLNEQESAYAEFKNWIILVLLVSLNVHHVFIEAIVNSFHDIPIGPSAKPLSIAKMSINIAQEAFVLGLRLAAPIITVQILINISLGLLNRILPSLNALAMGFPLSFTLSIFVILIGTSSFVSIVSTQGFQKQLAWLETSQRIFKENK